MVQNGFRPRIPLEIAKRPTVKRNLCRSIIVYHLPVYNSTVSSRYCSSSRVQAVGLFAPNDGAPVACVLNWQQSDKFGGNQPRRLSDSDLSKTNNACITLRFSTYVLKLGSCHRNGRALSGSVACRNGRLHSTPPSCTARPARPAHPIRDAPCFSNDSRELVDFSTRTSQNASITLHMFTEVLPKSTSKSRPSTSMFSPPSKIDHAQSLKHTGA
jgi:hypothetical protein